MKNLLLAVLIAGGCFAQDPFSLGRWTQGGFDVRVQTGVRPPAVDGAEWSEDNRAFVTISIASTDPDIVGASVEITLRMRDYSHSRYTRTMSLPRTEKAVTIEIGMSDVARFVDVLKVTPLRRSAAIAMKDIGTNY